MRILFITANYPPDHFGGYELRIKDIVYGLFRKDHEIRVLTTINSKNVQLAKTSPYPIHRKLHNRKKAKFFPKEILFDLIDTRLINSQISEFNPDVIYLGHIYNLSKSIIPFLSETNIPIVLDEGGASLKGAWTEKGRWFRFTGDYHSQFEFFNIIKPFVINLICIISKNRIRKDWSWPENLFVLVNNEHNFHNIKRLNASIRETRIIHSAINEDLFSFQVRDRINSPIRIIYPARIEPLKNQLDAITLIADLNNTGIPSLLTLVGPLHSEKYYQELCNSIEKLDIPNQVTILPMMTQEELAKLYHKSDIFFFPTLHKMGFSRTPLEAMACGCIAISYGNEGSDEIILPGDNGYLVKPGNFEEIIKIISEFCTSATQYQRVVKNAHQMIEMEYTLEEYLNRVEDFLVKDCSNASNLFLNQIQ